MVNLFLIAKDLPAHSLLPQSLYQRAPRIAVVEQGDLRKHVVRQIVQLLAGADRHKNMGGALFNEADNCAGYFSEGHGVFL